MGETKSLIENNVKTWNKHDKAGWTGDFADSVELKAPGGITGSGPEMVEQFYGIWQDAFPDTQVEPAVIAEDGDNGLLEAVFNGTHTEDLNAPQGTIQATQKAVSVPFVVVLKATGGKFTSFHLYFDQVELMTQLGVT
jgi:hypothetical protein